MSTEHSDCPETTSQMAARLARTRKPVSDETLRHWEQQGLLQTRKVAGMTADEKNHMSDAQALDQIAAILGLYTTDPASNPSSEVLADIVGYVQQTGRPTNAPEGA